MTLSTPVKVFVLAAVLAAVALMGSMMFMGGEDASASDAPIVLPTKKKAGVLEAPATAAKVAEKADAAAKAKAAGKAPAAPAAKKKAVAKPAPAAKKAIEVVPVAKAEPSYRGIATNGLPMRIAVALKRHSVVVVSIWGTGGKIDEMSRDEAAAGAAAAGAAFVPLNVIESSREAEALTLKLGVVLRAPTVLYFTKPDLLANRLDGFRDRETVAQGVLNALR